MKKKATVHPFLRMAGVKTEKEFYSKYPSDEDFFAAHPKARYGIAMAENGYQIGQFIPGLGYWDGNKFVPNPPAQPDPNWHPPMTDPNQPSQLPPLPGDKDGDGDGAGDNDKDGDGANNPPLPGAKKPKGKRSYKVSVGDKTWNPFAKDNAWNTGQGVATTDIVAGGLGMVDGALPFQPAKQNKNVLQPAVTQGNYGQGSQASFEDGGNISPTKAREMLHNPPHGKDLTEKQRRYFGAIASGYAADGGPMITNVPPSPYTYFRPMTKTNRQKMDMPNYEGSNIPVAQDGWASGIPGVGAYQAPVTDQEREDWNRYQAAMKRQPGTYVRNWRHNQDFQKQMAQQTGFDYNRAGAIQADMQARSQSMPGSVTGIQGSDPWGGDPNWVADREANKAYMKYQYLHYDPKHNLYPGEAGHKEASFTPMTKDQMQDWQNSAYAKSPNQWKSNTQGISMDAPQSEIDKLYQPGVQSSSSSVNSFGSNAPVASNSVTSKTKGFPTMEQAKAAHAKKKAGIETRWNPNTSEYEEVGKANKAVASVDDSGPGQEAFSIDALRSTGNSSDEARYGKEMISGMYHPDHDMEMMDAYPHKMGRMYRPYDHTYMAQGGYIPMGKQGLQVEGNQYRYLSPQTIELVGPKHSQGGIDIAYNGNVVEAEGGETFHVDNKGMWSGGNMAAAGTSMNSGIVGGNLYVPGTRTKFKDAFKDLASDEREASKIQDKASYFLNEYGQVDNGPTNKYRAPAFYYGKVLSDIYEQKKAQNKMSKTNLTETQNRMLELGGMIDPEHGAKKVSQMFKGKAKWGKKMAQDGAINKEGIEVQGPKPSNITETAWSSPDRQDFDIPGMYHPDLNYISPRFRPAMNLPGVTTDQPPMVNQLGTQPMIIEGNPESFVNKTQRLEAEAKDFVDSLGKDKPEGKSKNKVKGLRNKFRASDYLGEFATMFDQPEPVQSMDVQPYFESDYNVSFDNEKNAILSAFAPALRSAKTSAQQAAISAQMAEQLTNVAAKEFQFNQQNRAAILARNLGEARNVRDTKMKIGMDTIAKIDAARENTRENKFRAAQSFGTKEAQRRAQNLSLGMQEEYAGWKYDPAFKDHWEMIHNGETFDPRKVSEYDYQSFAESKKKKVTKTDSKGKKSETVTDEEGKKYYGGPMAYFGDYLPGIQRVYFAGGAVGGGMGHGGMYGMPGQQGSMASRYSPGGDTSYYEKKKKRKKVS